MLILLSLITKVSFNFKNNNGFENTIFYIILNNLRKKYKKKKYLA